MALAIQNNALIALAAAASWGGGDFSGGMGVKAAGGKVSDALRVIIIAHALSLAVLLTVLWTQHAPLPQGALLFWGLAAGVAAALSVTAFYIALSRGAMGASAAISGLLAAAIPAVVSSFIEGAPSAIRIGGFITAAIAIWLIAAGPTTEISHNPHQRGTMALAIGAGIGFGLYFVALKMDNPLGVLEPMALARSGSLVSCLLLLAILTLISRNSPPPQAQTSPTQSPFHLNRTVLLWVVSVALLDTAGNMFFVMATRMGRLDIASVLASLYPAATILLAAWVLHERPSPRQFAGMAIALAAVLMITL
ncbi:MAG: DMT family transporter [Acidobacteria bacterium]|nr:DMT family transporter [Acidobacteriota bacterium]